MTQVVIRLDDELTAALDDLVSSGAAASRSAALRDGLSLLVEKQRRDAVRSAIVEGYRRVPVAPDEQTWSDAASAAMIAEEPW